MATDIMADTAVLMGITAAIADTNMKGASAPFFLFSNAHGSAPLVPHVPTVAVLKPKRCVAVGG
jgi:hypothetical protein